jgi:hypothetical protein
MSSYVSSSVLGLARLRPLAASAAAIFAISTATAWAAPPAVTNCNDSGAGSLRDAVAAAASGDTIDFSTLTVGDPGCVSGITLTTGAIVISQQKLTIKGNGQRGIQIGQHAPNSRVITHSYPTAAGHLYFQDTKVNNGQITGAGQVSGGCILTLGSLTLNNVEIYQCSATTTGLSTDVPKPHAFGGGVYAGANLEIYGHSLLDHNAVYATNINVRAQGGCAETPGSFNMGYSIAAYCSAVGPPGGGGVRGGAFELKGPARITHSVIARSYATFLTGGVDLNGGMTTTATISNSSIAFNYSHDLVGGVYANSGHVNINNTTIVLNTARNNTYTIPPSTKVYYAPGLSVTGYFGPVALSLQSSIIANNTSNGTQEDLSTGDSTGVSIDASNNLVRAYFSDVTLPIAHGNLPKGTCPLLGHARPNGNGTYTFAPQSRSPVIDNGNNAANDPNTGVPALYDQRGIGYPRVSGLSVPLYADIGAHEVQQSDIVFNTEFETNCL